MHFHLPKPLHGWREFIGEIGIIVIGVLIALAAESVIERWHWQEQVARAREGIKEELGSGAFNAWERIALRQCFRSQLSALLERLNASGEQWKGMPVVRRPELAVTASIVAPAYAPPTRAYTTDSWKNALAAGIFNHMPAEDTAAFSSLFVELDQLAAIQQQEAVAASVLSPLSYDRRLDDGARMDMIAALAEVDRTRRLMDTVSQQYLEALRGMHLGFDAAKVRGARATLLRGQQEVRGACVQAPPLELG